MKKILILYATAGIGHKKASLAIKAAFDELSLIDTEVAIADSLDYTNSFFRWFYLKSYLVMVSKLPTLWGLSYYLTDTYIVNLFVSKLRRFSNWLNSAKLRRYLKETQPDIIISTHFFAGDVISAMKEKGTLRSRLITVVTDYRLHSWWIAGGTDTYVVGGDLAKADLLRWGVDDSKVQVLGIPVEPVFAKPLDKEAIRHKEGFTQGVFTILVLGGGFGVGPIVDIVKTIDTIRATVQMIVVCGHNEALAAELKALAPSLKKRIFVHGFVNNVYDYMSAADLLISKSGGITVSESLAKTLPLIVIKPIIGQETRNCDYLLSKSAAVKANEVADLKGMLEDLVNHPEKVEAMRRAIALIRKPEACYDIAKLGLEMIS